VKKQIRSAGVIAGLTLFTNILGLVREILTARALGASAVADAFLAAFSIASACFLVFSAATVQSAFMPVYQEVAALKAPAARGLFWRAFSVLGSILLLITVVFIWIAPKLVAVAVPGFSPDLQGLTVQLLRWLTPMILFVGTSSLLQSVSHANDHFTPPALVPLLNNLVIIGSLFVFVPNYGVTALAWGYLAGAMLWWYLFAFNRKQLFGIIEPAPPGTLKGVLITLGPLLILLVADQLSAVIQKTFVSNLGAGKIAALNYAARLEGLPVGIFSMAIATVFFPGLVRAIQSKNKNDWEQNFQQGLSAIILLTIPAMILLIGLAHPLVKLVFQRGVFDELATRLTAEALIYYAVGIVPQSLIVYFNRVFFAAKDTRSPMLIGLTAVVLHLISCWLGVRFIDYLGIALGTTIYAFVYAILLVIVLRNRMGIRITNMLTVTWRPCVAGSCMAFLLWWMGMPLDRHGLTISLTVTSSLYFISLWLLREPLVHLLLNWRRSGL
jgi:putative peptidoglycan lipid II flippase